MAAPISGDQPALWSSKFAFIMAAVGSSVGLGNLWRFSAEAGENGGGAFILIYLLAVLFVGIPVLMSEYIIGRAGKAASAVGSVKDIARASDVSPRWSVLGAVGMLASFLIVSFYCVVAAWVLMYIPKFLSGMFSVQSPAEISAQFKLTRESSMAVLPYYTAFGLLTIWLVARGVNKGIEWATKYLMPLFFILLVGLSVYSVMSGLGADTLGPDGIPSNGTADAFAFLFQPDFSKITPGVANAAMGQAFFSIGLGSAIMITYGSYLPKSVSIPRSAFLVAGMDTAVALIAGLAIFPIVFSHGLDVNSGAGLFLKPCP